MNKRTAFIAVIGAPNAGKSTLVNALVGAKVSIVTQKVQTTRARIRGILVECDTQLVFTDTPGIFSPRRRLDRAMVAAAWESLEGADAIVLVVDAAAELGPPSKSTADTAAIIAELKARGVRATLALNKIDKVSRPDLLALIASMTGHGVFGETFLIAAENGDGVGDLRAHLLACARPGEWHFPADQLSDISDRLMAAEITREKVFKRLHQELPYESTVETTGWTRTRKGELRVEQTIYVSRESQRPIVLGKGGATLKAIGEAARMELTDLLGEPVHLFLTVSVREGWAEEAARFREMGLDIVD
ncbi:MAG TPA: GTPase Era [Parvularcula sp.]|nr:GTPase Era [Parvularcula sp.]HBS36313.1 GTPase Era [Parvularcula sp.]